MIKQASKQTNNKKPNPPLPTHKQPISSTTEFLNQFPQERACLAVWQYSDWHIQTHKHRHTHTNRQIHWSSVHTYIFTDPSQSNTWMSYSRRGIVQLMTWTVNNLWLIFKTKFSELTRNNLHGWTRMNQLNWNQSFINGWPWSPENEVNFAGWPQDKEHWAHKIGILNEIPAVACWRWRHMEGWKCRVDSLFSIT